MKKTKSNKNYPLVL